MHAPRLLEAHMAYSPTGEGDIDLLRRSPAACHTAVTNLTGMPWPHAVRLGWTVRPVRIIAGRAEVEEIVDRAPPAAPPPTEEAIAAEIARAERSWKRPASSPIAAPTPIPTFGVVRVGHRPEHP